MTSLYLSFYGDDFTGSSDALEQLELGGIPAVLFLDIPTAEQLDQFPMVKAVGIAGVSRSMTPEQMDEALPPRFEALKSLGAAFVHYKVCSTFDSSPAVGSIGHATEIAWRVFEPRLVPLIVAAPFLGRYVVFGNLYARTGDVTYRLDRHPTMSAHPITPMDEADLRLHLGKQTSRQMGIVDVWHMMSMSDAELDAYVRTLIDQGTELIVFDSLDEHHLEIVGRLLWGLKSETPVFIVGSSGVEFALAQHLRSIGEIAAPAHLIPPEPVAQLLVMSGSAAPQTASQIDYCIAQGYAGIRLNAPDLVDPSTADQARETAIHAALDAIQAGKSVVMYSAKGPDDPAIGATKQRLDGLGFAAGSSGTRLAKQQGLILQRLLQESGLTRVCVAGGDTSGHVVSQLGIYALRLRIPIAPGSPLCVASSSDAGFDGLEIALKGGQNGKPDYFLAVQQGQAISE